MAKIAEKYTCPFFGMASGYFQKIICCYLGKGELLFSNDRFQVVKIIVQHNQQNADALQDAGLFLAQVLEIHRITECAG